MTATWQNPMRVRMEALERDFKSRLNQEKLRPFVTLVAHMIYLRVEWNGEEERNVHDWSIATELFLHWLLKGNSVGSHVDDWMLHLDTPQGCERICDTVLNEIENEWARGTFKPPYGKLIPHPQIQDKASYVLGIIESAMPR